MHRKLADSKHAIATVTAVFMLLIMIAAMTILVTFFLSNNDSMQKQMNIEKAQAQEQISITNIGVDSTHTINNITVKNTGSVEVIIRALYREDSAGTVFLADPRTPIPLGTSRTLDVSGLGLTEQSDSKFFASTERGTKSMEVNEVEINYRDYVSTTNSSALSIGPLWLTFDSLNWAAVNPTTGEVIGDWNQTWTVPTGSCAWRLNVTNVDTDKRNITITSFSGFTLSLVGYPSTTTWYLRDMEQTINWNTTATITFLWDSVRSLPVSLGQSQATHGGINNVFLTFFGSYSDGQSLAQTIPFEAIKVT